MHPPLWYWEFYGGIVFFAVPLFLLIPLNMKRFGGRVGLSLGKRIAGSVIMLVLMYFIFGLFYGIVDWIVRDVLSS
jgi:hypothetical protein